MKIILFEKWTGNNINGHWYTKKKKFDVLLLKIIKDNCRKSPNRIRNIRVVEK